MIIGVTDPETNIEHKVEWDSDKPPTEQELPEVLQFARGQKQSTTTDESTSFDSHPLNYFAKKAKDAAVGIGQSVVGGMEEFGDTAKDLLMGNTIRNLVSKDAPTNKSDSALNNAISAITQPTILNTMSNTSEGLTEGNAIRKDYIDKYSNLEKLIETDPLRPIMDASLLIPSVGAGMEFLKGAPDIENIVYHGTHDVDALMHGLDNGQTMSGKYGSGLYVTGNKDYADLMHNNGIVGKNPGTVSINTNGLNFKNINDDEWINLLKDQSGNNPKNISPDIIANKFEAQGYDGLNLTDAGFKLIFNPKKVNIIDGAELLGKTEQPNGIPVANIIASGAQPSNILNIVKDPALASKVHAGMGFQVEGENGLLNQAADSIKNTHDSISKAQSDFYKNAGITDETPTVWNKPILGKLIDGTRAEPITPIESMRKAIIDYRNMATSDEIPIADKADELINKITLDSKFDDQQNMNLPFGMAKKYSQKFYDLSQKYRDDPSAQNLFNNMYQVAKSAKNSIPEIANASDSFHDLSNAKEMLENSFPSLGTGKDFMVDKKLMRLYKDNGNLAFRQNLDNAASILSKYPESAPLANFTKNMKELNIGLDMEKGKAASPLEDQAGKIPFLSSIANALKMKPSTKLPLIAQGSKNGWISKEGVEGTIQPSRVPFLAPAINTVKAYGKAINTPEWISSLGGGIKKSVPPAVQIMSLGRIANSRNKDNSLNSAIRNLIQK